MRETFREFDDGDYFHRADFWTPQKGYVIPVHADDDPADWRWQPSIHMPRRLSRILIEITDVRVERLQDILTRDILAEGYVAPKLEEVFDANDLARVQRLPENRRALALGVLTRKPGSPPPPREWFRLLWDSLNAKRGCGWDANPWIWCLTFRRITHA